VWLGVAAGVARCPSSFGTAITGKRASGTVTAGSGSTRTGMSITPRMDAAIIAKYGNASASVPMIPNQ
jgi:hypothetical protein